MPSDNLRYELEAHAQTARKLLANDEWVPSRLLWSRLVGWLEASLSALPETAAVEPVGVTFDLLAASQTNTEPHFAEALSHDRASLYVALPETAAVEPVGVRTIQQQFRDAVNRPVASPPDLQARLAEVEKALKHDLNVNDEELLRIRNMCERDGNIKIWARMVQKITDSVRAARRALSQEGQ